MDRLVKIMSVKELKSHGPFLGRVKESFEKLNGRIYPKDTHISLLDPEADGFEDPSLSWDEALEQGGTFQFEFDEPADEEEEEED